MSDSRLDGVPGTKAKKEIRRPLKPRDHKFIKAKIDNPDLPNYKAAMIATGSTTMASANVTAQRMLQNVSLREALDEAMYKQGLSLDLIMAPVTEALNFEGDTPRETTDMRLRGHDRAMKALQIVGGEQGQGGNTINFNFSNGSSFLKPATNIPTGE